MKRYVSLILVSMMIAMLLWGCAPQKQTVKKQGLTIVTTLFPTYDFARTISGGKADITLLLTPGKESHSYEPSTGDVIRISESDIFIYTGKYMEPWAEKLISSMEQGPCVVDAGEGLVLEGSEQDEHDEHGHSGHAHEKEPHIWTSPKMCLTIVDNILRAMAELDEENADYYRANAETLKNQLSELDEEFRSIASQAKEKEIFHGGRFSMYYFAKEYGLSWEAAYDSCSADAEPSLGKVCGMIDEMREKKTKVIFYEELSNNSVAKLIADETGARPLLLHSCHNLTEEEFKEGRTYLDFMRQNAENLREALL